MKKTRGHWVRGYGGYGGVYGPNVLAPGGYYEARCYRCDRREQLLLPCSLELAGVWMKAVARIHSRCRQTLLGARMDLIDALYSRKWRLEHPRER